MKPFILPTSPSPASMMEPLNLCAYGGYGVGKTSIFAKLPHSVNFDCQRGTLTYECCRVDILGEAEARGIQPYEMFEMAALQIREAKPWFVIVDTIGELADWADAKALDKFRASPMGKSWDKGAGFQYPSILDLPGERGSAGWGKLWDAFQQLLLCVQGSQHRTIFLGHPRDKIAFATGKDPNVKQDVVASSEDLDIAGKMRRIFSSKMAAVGYMYRDWSNPMQVNMSFTGANFVKTRCPHLEGRTLPFRHPNEPGILNDLARIYPQTLAEHLLPADREALAPLLAQYGGVAAQPAQPPTPPTP